MDVLLLMKELLITSSNDFIDLLQKKIKIGKKYSKNNGKNSCIYFLNKKNIIKFVHYIYDNATIFLSRKYEKSMHIINHLENKKFFYSGERIAQYDLNDNLVKIWNNIDDIKQNTNYNTQTILRNIKGKIKTSNKFKFKIYD